jgi:hypothetical protein
VRVLRVNAGSSSVKHIEAASGDCEIRDGGMPRIHAREDLEIAHHARTVARRHAPENK